MDQNIPVQDVVTIKDMENDLENEANESADNASKSELPILPHRNLTKDMIDNILEDNGDEIKTEKDNHLLHKFGTKRHLKK